MPNKPTAPYNHGIERKLDQFLFRLYIEEFVTQTPVVNYFPLTIISHFIFSNLLAFVIHLDTAYVLDT